MSKGIFNPDVDFYFAKATKWRAELLQLRNILLAADLTEELKWGVPCYTNEKKNIVLIHDFKEYCAVLFFKGALLNDSKKILVQQTENVQAARQMRFTNVSEIVKHKRLLSFFVKEAIGIEKAGIKVEMKKTTEFPVPVEFQNALDKRPKLKTAFEKLTPGRQRAYLLHFSAPKQATTREARVKKAMVQILDGKGLNDN